MTIRPARSKYVEACRKGHSLLSCKGNVYLQWGAMNAMSTTGKFGTSVPK